MGFMSKVLKEDLFLVDFTYQLEIAKKAKEAGAQGIINVGGEDTSMYELALKTNPKVKSNECEHPVPNTLTMNTNKMKELL